MRGYVVSMVRCSKCGAKLNKKDNFCRTCGEKVIHIEQYNRLDKSFHESTSKMNTTGNKKPNNKRNGIIALILIFVIIVILGSGSDTSNTDKPKEPNNVWTSIKLKDKIPELGVIDTDIVVNEINVLNLCITGYDESKFTFYVNKCIDGGYIIDTKYQENVSYQACNDQGDLLVLTYKDNTMSLKLDVYDTSKYIQWDDYHQLYNVPVYNRCEGNVITDTDDEIKITVMNVDQDQYHVYVSKCIAAGFNMNKKQDDYSYSANNKKGVSLSSTYSTNRTMDIVVKRPMYNVLTEIYFVNFGVFNTYDLEVFVDGNFKGTFNDADRRVLEWTLSEGKHAVEFVSHKDKNVSVTDYIIVNEDTKFIYNVDGWKEEIEYERNDYIGVAYINQDLGKLKIDEVLKAYKDLGYKNIELKPLSDLDYNNYNKHNGIVTLIEVGNSYNVINKKDSLKRKNKYFSNQPIKIHYHSAKELVMPGSVDSLKKLTRDEVVKYMKDLGFTNIKTQKYDGKYPSDVKNLGVHDVSINGKNDFKQGNDFAFDSEIVIVYYDE